MTKKKPYEAMRRIVKHALDMSDQAGKAIPKLVKKPLLSLMSRPILMTAEDSVTLTARRQEISQMGEERKTGR
jgi:hypothetical protein